MGSVSVDIAEGSVERQREWSAAWLIGCVGAFMLATGLVVLLLHTSTSLNVKDLFVDPAAKGQLASHVGLVSHLGVLALWTGATALVGCGLLAGHEKGRGLLLFLGGLLGWMAIDDLFLIHEELGGIIARYILPAIDRRLLESVVFALTGVAWLVWLTRYRATLRRDPRAPVLLGALVLLAASVGCDIGEILMEDWARLSEGRTTAIAVLEDLLKLGGIMLLMIYAVHVARQPLRPETSRG